MTKSHRWRALKWDTSLKVLIAVLLLLCIIVPLQTVAANNLVVNGWPKIPLYNWSDPMDIPASLTVNQFHARTDPSTCTFEVEFYAFPNGTLAEGSTFRFNFNDGSAPLVTPLPYASHAYGPGMWHPNVTVWPFQASPYTIPLPMPLIIVPVDGCGV